MATAAGQQIPFFGMEHARDLLEKLEWEFERLTEAPNNKFAAFNFFVTAEHLLDWIYPGRNKTAREARRSSEPLLEVVSHLCNRAKHLRLGTTHTSVMKAEVGLAPPRAIYMGRSFHQAWGPRHSVLWIYVAPNLQPAFQDRITPIDLAKLTLAYWRAQPEVQ